MKKKAKKKVSLKVKELGNVRAPNGADSAKGNGDGNGATTQGAWCCW